MGKLLFRNFQRRIWDNCSVVSGTLLIVLLLGQIARSEGVQVSTQCRLQWSPSLEPEITGYRVYLGRARNQYFPPKEVLRPKAEITCQEMGAVELGQYFVTVTSIGNIGEESSTAPDLPFVIVSQLPNEPDSTPPDAPKNLQAK